MTECAFCLGLGSGLPEKSIGNDNHVYIAQINGSLWERNTLYYNPRVARTVCNST